ncbi:hypothetical protein FB45DRAFT_1011223 [Roridomyces roridus]|uniref:Uncharacterized protein n=1 Tax=Roridomyces roridus TaxID=1738132 RepID=A0AAD7FA80_9AGAR|nr:hypothetical protein FB45DRAFT_1011223 [Roridomyces roridus]
MHQRRRILSPSKGTAPRSPSIKGVPRHRAVNRRPACGRTNPVSRTVRRGNEDLSLEDLEEVDEEDLGHLASDNEDFERNFNEALPYVDSDPEDPPESDDESDPDPLDDPALIEMPDVTGGSGDGVQPPTHADDAHAAHGHADDAHAAHGHADDAHAAHGHADDDHAAHGHAAHGHAYRQHADDAHACHEHGEHADDARKHGDHASRPYDSTHACWPPVCTRPISILFLFTHPHPSSSIHVPPPPPPAANSSTASAAPAATPTVNPAKPKLDSVTARNIAMAVYAADVGGSNPQFGAHWTALRENCPLLYQAYEKYSKELKQKGVKELPDLEAIRGVIAVVPASEVPA